MIRARSRFVLLLLIANALMPARMGAQELLRRTFADFTASLQSVDDSGYAHFRVAWITGPVIDFTVFGVVADSAHASDIEIRAFGTDRLYFANSREYFVVDPHTGELLDQFVVGAGEVSPDSRFVAFDNFIGRGNPDDGTVYFVYDMALSPAQNRMSASSSPGPTGRLSTFQAGWAVYPDENRSGRTYLATVATPASDHHAQSPFFWSDSRTLTFADYSNGITKAVLVTLNEGSHEITVRAEPVNPASVLDYSRLEPGVPPAEYLRISWIGVVVAEGRPTLRLTFPGEDPKYRQWSLDVPF